MSPPLTSGQKIDFLPIHDTRGNLSVAEGNIHLPFPIKRVYWLYDVPGGSERGGHAHKQLQQVAIAMSGSFDLILDDGRDKQRIHLNRSHFGVFIGPNTWREMDNFSSGAVCLVLASEIYDETDYIRDYAQFLQWIRG